MSHARLGPSNHRWPHCPGSIREEERYPDTSNPAAIDGTGSHLLLEMCLLQKKAAEDFLGETIGVGDKDKPSGWLVKQDRCDRVQICIDYVVRREKELEEQFPDCRVTTIAESRSNPGAIYQRDDWWGTVDITIEVVNYHDVLVFVEICDYKDGRGFVSEKDNSQLNSYCIGKAHYGACKNVRMSIVQPKTNPPIRYEDIPMVTLRERASKLSAAAAATDDENAPCIPGDHCLWCKANPKRGGHCTAAVSKSLEVINVNEITNLTADIATLDNEQLAELADQKDTILAQFERIETEIQSRLETGQEVEGYAMQPGNSSYVWNEDPEKIEKVLKGRRLTKAEIYPAKLLSVAQMRKSDKLTKEQIKKIEAEYVTEKVGKLKLKRVAKKEKDSKSLFAEVSQIEKPNNEISFF